MQNTREYLQRHHGGNGSKAASKTIETHSRNHDQAFQDFFNNNCPKVVSPTMSVLDLGCGTGLWLNEMADRYPQANLTGIELAPYMLERMESLADNITIITDDLNNPVTEFPAKSIHIALANLLIHELHQPVTLFSKLRNWMKPDGIFILCDMVRQPLSDYLKYQYANIDLATETPEYELLLNAFQHFQEHNRYHPQDLVDLLELCGFKVIDTELFKKGRAVRIAATVA